MIDRLKETISALQDDDLTVAGITDAAEWKKIGIDLGAHTSNALKNVYSMTNGFSNYHQGSQIILWSVEKIISNRKYMTDSLIRVGDFLMESDYIVIIIEGKSTIVKMQYDDRTLAVSLDDFVSKISEGRFDFM